MVPVSYILAAIAGTALIASATGYMTGYSKGYKAMEVKCSAQIDAIAKDAAKEKQRLEDDIADASIAFENLRTERSATSERITNTIREIYKNVEVPSRCEPPADALGLLDDQIRRANAVASGKSGQ